MYTDIFANYSYGERIVNGLLVAVSGLLMVFLVLFLLMVLIMLMSWIINKAQKKSASKAETNDIIPEQTALAETTEAVQESDDRQIIAAITAAITAFRAQENSNVSSSFRVVSFTKSKKIN